MKPTTDIVITGEGIVCAAGLNKGAVLHSLRERRSGVGAMRYLTYDGDSFPVGEVKMTTADMRGALGLTSKAIGRTPLMGIMAVSEALADAAVDKACVETAALRIVLISGTTVGGMDITEQCFRGGNGTIDSDALAECMAYHDCGSSTKIIADYFGLFTDYTTPSTACSSAANAIILGARLLATGQADIVVAGGSEALSVFHLTGFSSLMILDRERCRPFDAERHGLNLGEGAGYVVMESAATAKRRGVAAHATLRGYANTCDAFHQTATSPEATGAYLAITEALTMAGLAAADIDYINAHGTGTPNNDETETTAIRRVFGDNYPAVSSTKPFTGHTTSASGGIEAVICVMAIRHGLIPANIGWEGSDDKTLIPSLGVDTAEVHNVMCNSFGFGGNDSVLIFSDRCGAGDTPSELSCENTVNIKELSRVEITDESRLAEIKRYVKPLESRRMCKLLKAALLSSLQALDTAGVSEPDAIITATARGCLENSERYAIQVFCGEGSAASPTLFMQSTHNTMASAIAIRLHCHGYNMTYSQEERSLEWALRDARMLIESGQAKTVLVECHDEYTDRVLEALSRNHDVSDKKKIKSTAIVLSC